MIDPDQVWGLVSDVHGNYPALEQALGLLSVAVVDFAHGHMWHIALDPAQSRISAK
jgi:hypothetical protein